MSPLDRRHVLPWLVLCACTSADPPAAAVPPPVADPPAAKPPAPAPADPPAPIDPIPANAKLELSRGACYGPCPVYTVTIDAQGRVEWDGEKHVEHVGLRRKQLDSLDALRDLWRRLDPAASQLLATDEATWCPEQFSDSPTVVVTIVAHGAERRVSDYQGCKGHAPLEAFRALEDEIDAVAGTAEWIGKRE